MLEKTMRLNYLLDFYHTLLTPKQREYMEMYYLEDYSLVEIANHADVSRQAVYDNIKRTEDILESYEQSIQLYEKFQMRISLLNALEKSIDEEQEEKIHSLIDQLKELG
ncbi:MAG TPA: putative DNA-binding protein [Bacillota bacterium]|nr:putative DNA-binding protein [Bacillota bacterium]